MHAFISLLKAFSIVSLFLALTAGIYIALNSGDLPPPDVSDLHVPYPDVPDEENAFTLFAEAAGMLDFSDDEHDLIRSVSKGEPIPVDQLEPLINSYRKPLNLIAEGARRKRCVFPRVSSGSDLLPALSQLIQATNLFSAMAMMEQHSPDLESISITFDVGDSLIAEPESLIQYLVGHSTLVIACHTTQEALRAPDLQTNDLLGFRKHLPELEDIRQGYQASMKAEFRVQMNTTKELFTLLRKPWREDTTMLEFDGWMRWACRVSPRYFLKPNKTILAFAEESRRLISNANKPLGQMNLEEHDNPTMRFYESYQGRMYPNILGDLLNSVLAPLNTSMLVKVCNLQAERSATDTLIAIRLFHESTGGLPWTMSDLVPEFLPEIPRDPFDGQPFRYDPERRMVWSVGEDLIDQNGSTIQREETPSDERRHQEDLVWKMRW